MTGLAGRKPEWPRKRGRRPQSDPHIAKMRRKACLVKGAQLVLQSARLRAERSGCIQQ